MSRRLSTALLIAIPCLLALLAYDVIAVYLLRQGEYRLVPAHDLARGMLQDVGLVSIYAVAMTARVAKVVDGYEERSRRLCLIMLGLGIAWYDVVCAWVTRLLPTPPDFWMSGVVLFVIPIILAPWYVRWLKTKVPEG
jgi:hypothetical protein